MEKQTIKNRSSKSSPEGFFYVPAIKLHVARERTLYLSNWIEAHQKLQKNGERMLTLPEFREVLKYSKTNEPAVYRDITALSNDFNSEMLDTQFRFKDGITYVNSHHIYKNGELIPQNHEVVDKSALMESRNIHTSFGELYKNNKLVPGIRSSEIAKIMSNHETHGISLEDWIESSTKQGLPNKNIGPGRLHYFPPSEHPIDNFGDLSTVGFYATPENIHLSCDDNSLQHLFQCGVRAARN